MPLAVGPLASPRGIGTTGLCCAPSLRDPPHMDTSTAQGSVGKKTEDELNLQSTWRKNCHKSRQVHQTIHPPRTTDNRLVSKRFKNTYIKIVRVKGRNKTEAF